uniref:SAM domain-containing protein n=1 Tax=Plectus sambesii TaxID=2011161 RepID=A0A914UTH9_9BILA
EKAPQYCSRECKRKERKRLRSFETSPDEQSTSYTLPVITSPTVKIKPIVDPATAAAPPILSHPPPPPATAVSNKHPTEWTVEEVHNWVMSVNGAQASAEIFKQQEIDGQALMLLNEDHLMRTLGLKLGPAVKLQSALKALKESVGR